MGKFIKNARNIRPRRFGLPLFHARAALPLSQITPRLQSETREPLADRSLGRADSQNSQTADNEECRGVQSGWGENARSGAIGDRRGRRSCQHRGISEDIQPRQSDGSSGSTPASGPEDLPLYSAHSACCTGRKLASEEQRSRSAHGTHDGRGFPTTSFSIPNQYILLLCWRSGVVELKCNAGHVWMNAEVLVVKHAYYAVTRQSIGFFKLTDVPPGEYEIEAWHEGWRIASEQKVLDVGSQVE